ncbi:hypothetical protein [Allosphingosinicella vermicomposti]|uniref:hypothetical protein n=1 Tax=Allosphingosinicella vermicomposti TaxID=614671 RepID=UPI00131A5899|nr:hypothetical protein [Allosphingosinicella vermicomposti]
MLIKKNDGTTVTASSGEDVDGWQVGKIGRDRVSLIMNGEHVEAVLGFANKPPPGNTPQSTQPSPPISPQQTEAQPQTPGPSS